MYGLDLFSGIGGITLALSKYVTPITYCESDTYAQSVLLSRMYEGFIPRAPIWDDVRTLSSEILYPQIDIIYGGFPCQDISVAGRGEGLAGERSGLFWEVVRLSCELRPNFVFLENVPAITTRGGVEVVSAFTSLGYDSRWCVVSAAGIGAPHKRERWFFMAHANGARLQETGAKQQATRTEQCGYAPHTQGERLQRLRADREQEPQTYGGERLPVRYGENPEWWSVEPDVDRVVNGLPNRVDRIKCLGNAVVPLQAQKAFEILIGGFNE